MKSWKTEESSWMRPGDGRLNKGATVLMERLSNKPTVNIPMMRPSWGETVDTYRSPGSDDFE